MPSSWIWKINVSLFLTLAFNGWTATKDTTAFTNFRNYKVVYADLGYTTAPFWIKYPFKPELGQIAYKNNYRPFLGLGFAYKWFSLRVAFPVLSFLRPDEKYGTTRQFGLGFDYTWKKTFLDAEFMTVRGYAVRGANRWDSTIVAPQTNSFKPSLLAYNVTLNAWYFADKNFKMNALIGKRAHYLKEVHTWYLKGTFNIFGLDNGSTAIIPTQLANPSNSKTSATSMSAVDFGAVPGYAYVNRIKNWQFAGWFGIGGVIQSKFYQYENESRGFLGLAPRYDIRIMGGYSSDKLFVFLNTDFDNKSIRFTDVLYRQFFYSMRIVAGYRFAEKAK